VPWLIGICVGSLLLALLSSVLQLAPFGVGRPDIYLYPSIALLIALLVNAITEFLPTRFRPIVLFVVLAPLLFANKANAYPDEDVRSIVSIVDSDAKQGDAVIVYPQDGYIFALYSRFDVRIKASELSMTGFTTAVDHPGVNT
jgi:hypothetical protein